MKKIFLIGLLAFAFTASAQNKWIRVDPRVSGSPLTFDLYQKQPDNSYALLKTGSSTYLYTFDNLPAGIYRFHVDIPYNKYLPTWHPRKVYWEEASDIDLTVADTFVAGDGLLSNPAHSGPASISGEMTQGLLKKAPGDPLKNIRVIIVDGADQFVTMVNTNDSGRFSVSGLPLGTYRIRTDLMNVLNPNPKTVVVDSIHPSASVMLTVNRNGTNNTGISGVSPAMPGISIFPNPSAGSICILAGVPFSFEITDLSGKTVMYGQGGREGVTADLRTLQNGAYFIRLIRGTSVSVQRILLSR